MNLWDRLRGVATEPQPEEAGAEIVMERGEDGEMKVVIEHGNED